MPLDRYWQKRNFENTPEPKGHVGRKKSKELSYIIQKHQASHLHYDFRLELDGVLLSWAVPKGPSLDPADKRLAMHVEDHPLEYGDFEGVIPPKQYGSGTVMLWDRGRWIPEGDPREMYRRGRLKFSLDGEKLHGSWALVKTWGKDGDDKRWLLLKHDDEHAIAASIRNITEDEDRSVITNRNLEEIKAAKDAQWHSNKSVKQNVKGGALAASRSAGKAVVDPKAIDGAKKAAMPDEMGAQLCTLVKKVPGGEGWLHEIKYDGYRMLARVENGKVTIVSRNGKEWTAQLGPVVDALKTLPVKQAWLDGEVVVLLPDGRTSFQELQNALGANPAALKYFVFDLLHLDGYDLRRVPLIDRKLALKKLLVGKSGVLNYSDHIEGDGEAFFREGCKRQLEGIICKQRDAPHRATRGGDWVKVKCSLRQELVIAGYTDPGGSRTGFGALLLGAYEGKQLKYVGKVGTGFDTKTLKDIYKRVRALETKEPAFVNPPRGYEAKGAHWIKPELVGEIEFTEWTREGTARHPSFKGLRLDKKASQVKIEKPADVDEVAPPKKAARSRKKKVDDDPEPEPAPAPRSPPKFRRAAVPRSIADEKPIAISNPDKVLYPEGGITKMEIAEYYRAIGRWMQPHLEGRPLTLVRCPNGYGAKCFYQKHVKDGTPDILTRVKVPEGDGFATYMSADSVEAIVALLQMGVLEIHPWGSRVPDLSKPDRIIFDFDPDEGLDYPRVVEAAKLMRLGLEQIGLTSFVKTTGGKGLHVVVPIVPQYGWDVVKAFTQAVAISFSVGFPGQFTANLAKKSRGNKIFIDYLRNAEGATAIAPYSVRAKKNAPVAFPIEWESIEEDRRFDHYNVRNVPKLLATMKRDPWRDFLTTRQKLTPAMLKSVGVKV